MVGRGTGMPVMYLDNKYTRIYYSLIDRAKSRGFGSKKAAKSHLGYVETHHIIPRSLGGNNSKSNLVYLTAREHFICHLLLIKMTVGEQRQKMIFAVSNFKNRKKDKKSDYKISSRTYEIIRRIVSSELSQINKGKTAWNKGIPQDEETNKKRSLALSGIPHTEEHRKNNSLSRKDKKRTYSEEGISNIVEAAKLRRGVPLTEDQLKNRIGNVWWNNGSHQTRSKICPGDDYVRGRIN